MKDKMKHFSTYIRAALACYVSMTPDQQAQLAAADRTGICHNNHLINKNRQPISCRKAKLSRKMPKGENKVQEISTMFAKCDTMEQKCRLRALFSSLSAQEKQEVLSYAESLLNSRKE